MKELKEERKKLLQRLKDEKDALKTECLVVPYNDNDTKKLIKFEVNILKDGVYAFRGFNIFKYKEQGVLKVHNGDLYEPMKNEILSSIFVKDKDGNSLLNDRYKFERKDLGLKFQVKRSGNKKIKFLFNGNSLFTLRLVKDDGKYKITTQALNKAINVVQDKLEDIFCSTVEDFNKYKKLISLIIEYLYMS